MRKSLAAFAFFLLLFSVSAQAVYVDVPGTIIVQGEQKDVPVTIKNDGFKQEEYNISFFVPFRASISPSYGTLPAGKATVSSLSIQPDKSLEGSSYDVTLEVRLGQEKAFRNIRVIFKESGAAEETGGRAGVGFFSLGAASDFIVSLLTFENMVNAALILIAAILLIAFIARFVRRLEEIRK